MQCAHSPSVEVYAKSRDFSHAASAIVIQRVRGYGYTLFQTPKPIAMMYKEGGWTAGEIAKNFDAAFREHLSVPGLPPTPALQAAAAAAKKP